MKILVIGDFHGKFPSKLKGFAKKSDIILCTGDLGGSDKLLKIISKYLGQDWWEIIGEKKAKKYVLEDYNSGKKIINELDSFGKPVYLIPGNWDFTAGNRSERTAKMKLKTYKELVKNTKNIIWWNRGFKKLNGLNILAWGDMVTAYAYLSEKKIFDKKKRDKYKKKNKKEVEQLIKKGRKDIDILFTHYTPYLYFDKVKSIKENPMNGKHVGFVGFTEYIKKYQPKISISGHMHEYQGMKNLGKTKIIETGSAKKGKGVLIEIDDFTKKVNKISFIK